MTDESPAPPEPEPVGARISPVRHPPTAVGTATPESRPPVGPSSDRMPPAPALVRTLRRALNAALDVADDLADILAGAIDSVRRPRPRPRP